MAYDTALCERVQALLSDRDGYTDKRMFGGVAFLAHGNMACGISGDELIVRVGPRDYDAALGEDGTHPFDITGRPMTGWVMVAPDGWGDDDGLREWVERGWRFASTLPAK